MKRDNRSKYSLKSVMELEEDTQLIWGGDFNSLFDCKLDADGGNPKLKIQSITKLVSIMSENDLCDIVRVRNPEMKRYTWRRKTPFKQRRLDYFLVSDHLQDQIDHVDIIYSIQSDHSTLKLKVCGAKHSLKGPSYWKLNNSLLQDNAFTERFKTEIPKFFQESEELRNPMMRWKYLKYKVREFSKKYSVDKAKEMREKRNKLELRVKELEILISSNAEETVIQEYHDCKHQLEEMYNYITQGIILRSRVDWYEHGGTFPTFYQELIELWCKISYQKPSDITQIYNRSLWYNSFIVRQGKPIFNLSFINKGIINVRDILNDAGNFLSWHLCTSKYNLDNKDFISWIGLIESIPQM